MAYKQIEKYRALTVDVTTTNAEISAIYGKIIADQSAYEDKQKYYHMFQPYLRHFHDYEITTDEIDRIRTEIKNIYYEITHLLRINMRAEIRGLVERTLAKTAPICVHNKERGLVVKLFKIYDVCGRPRMLKTFQFMDKIQYVDKNSAKNAKNSTENSTENSADNATDNLVENSMADSIYSCMYVDMIKQNIVNEIVFQEYAISVQKRTFDFIVPKIYDFGHFKYDGNDTTGTETNQYCCYYIMMEFIEGVRLREVIMHRNGCEHLYTMKKIDTVFRTNLLHHNDLHGDNVIITPDKQIAIIDFGEAACGPTTLREPNPPSLI